MVWSNFTKSWWRVYLGFLCLGIVVYVNSWGNELFWDDLDNFVNNQYVHSWEYFGNYFSQNLIAGSGLDSNYWRPMMLFVWSLCWGFWQDWAAGYRIVNLLLHVGCGVLIYQIWNKLFDRKWLSIAVSSLFIVHPLQTEAISYASGISDPLAGVFILGSIYGYLKYRLDVWKWGLLLSWSLMIGGLMSRETVVILPAGIGMIELFLFLDNRVENSRQGWLSKIWWIIGGFGLISGIYLWLRGTILNFGGTFNIYQEENEFTSHPVYRILTFWKVLALFVGLLWYPVGLHMDRVIDIERGLSNPLVWVGLILSLVSIGVVIIGLKNWRRWRVLIFGLGWFWLWIFPISNIVIPVNGLMYEHWMYLPMIGFWTMIVYPVGVWCQHKMRQRIGIGLLLIVIMWLGFMTIQRNRDWSEATTFYKQVLGYNPKSLRVWNNLAMTYANRGQLDAAIPIYEQAHQLDPDNWVPIHNLGNAYRDKGQFDIALKYYVEALQKNPNASVTLNALVRMILDQKKYKEGIQAMETLISEKGSQIDFKIALIVITIEDKNKIVAQKYWDQLKVVDSANPLLLDLKNRIEGINENINNNSSI